MIKPKICVILATYNGAKNLRVQLDSIINQSNADISVFVYDDQSKDETREILTQYTLTDDRVKLCGWDVPSGGAFQNFRAAILDDDRSDFEYIAFADQDDIWQSNKISRQVSVIRESGSVGCSSSVIAFYEDSGKKEKLINNVGVQTACDYLFEGGGQGCTYLFAAQAYRDLRAAYRCHENHGALGTVPHDWLLYALCRASNRRWSIIAEPLVKYRQHGANVMGARGGWRSVAHRLRMLQSGAFKRQRVLICSIVAELFPAGVPVEIKSSNICFLRRFAFAMSRPFAFRRFKGHSLLIAVLFVLNIA